MSYFTVEDVVSMSASQRREVLLSAHWAAERGTRLPASVQELVSWYRSNYDGWGNVPRGFDERAAAIPAEDIHTFVHDHMREGRFFGKHLRPWTLVPRVIGQRYLRTDRSMRVGIEVELSYPTVDARTAAMAWVTDNLPYTSLDQEGAGVGGLEVTFAPMSQRQLFSEDSPLVRYLRYAQEHGATGQVEGCGGTWGMHVNVSCRNPQRALSVGLNYDNRTISGIALAAAQRAGVASDYPNVCLLLHGRRTPYGAAYQQNGYVEYKVSASTIDIEKAKHYVKVITAMYAYQFARTINEEQITALLAGAMRTSPFATAPAVDDATDWGVMLDDEDETSVTEEVA